MNRVLSLAPIAAGLAFIFAFAATTTSQEQKDLNRPACVSARCRKIESFVKAHYCGDSPYGNGPDDGCEIKRISKPQDGVEVLADYHCEWNQTKQAADCEQKGNPSVAVHKILLDAMRHIGLPANAKGQTYFTVWESSRSGLLIAQAHYSRSVGSDLDLCEVIAAVDKQSHVTTIRKLPFKKTDADVPDVTQWAPVDLVDIEGDGHEDLVLEGDAYENHWLQVVSFRDGSAETIFSGLGYYL